MIKCRHQSVFFQNVVSVQFSRIGFHSHRKTFSAGLFFGYTRSASLALASLQLLGGLGASLVQPGSSALPSAEHPRDGLGAGPRGASEGSCRAAFPGKAAGRPHWKPLCLLFVLLPEAAVRRVPAGCHALSGVDSPGSPARIPLPLPAGPLGCTRRRAAIAASK